MKRFNFTENQKKELLWWADVLDGTTENQGPNALKQYDYIEDGNPKLIHRYCCLGIYLNAKDPDIWWLDLEDGQEPGAGHTFYVDDFETSYLPPKFKKMLGMTSKNNVHLQDFFTEMNDSLCMSFSEIAAEIRILVDTGFFSERIMSSGVIERIRGFVK